MNPLTRDRSILVAKPLLEHVLINPELTREAQFDKWFDALAPLCERHQRTRLVLDRAASKTDSLSRSVEEICYDWWYRNYARDPKPRNDHYPFVAQFHCPACKLQYARVPPEFCESSFEGFRTDTAELASNLAKCREFASQVNKRRCGFLLMSGFSGNGKTRLACNILRELNNPDALYVRQGELTIALRATYGRKDLVLRPPPRRGDEAYDDEPPTLLEIIQQIRFVVLDEISCNPLANDERLFLDELIKYRYEKRCPTILISNLPIGDLKTFLGDALTERIAHAAGNGRFILQFSGDSFRRTSGETYLEGLG